MSYLSFMDHAESSNNQFKEITGFYGTIKGWDAEGDGYLELTGSFDCYDLFQRNDGVQIEGTEETFSFNDTSLKKRYLAQSIDIPINGKIGEMTLAKCFEDNSDCLDRYTPEQQEVLTKAFDLIKKQYSDLIQDWYEIKECTWNLNEFDESIVDHLSHENPELTITLNTKYPNYENGWGISTDKNHWNEECNLSDISNRSYMAADVTLTVGAGASVFEWRSDGYISAKAEEFDDLLRSLFRPLIDQAKHYLTEQNEA